MIKMQKFAMDSVEFVDSAEKSLFRHMRIKAFASGENTWTLPVDEDVLKRGADTIYNKPILWKYNKYTDDANTHDLDEVPCGFIPKEEDNPVTFEQSEDERLFIVINALIWTKYCGRLIEIFKRDDYRKSVSIEIIVNADEPAFGEKPEIKDFVVAGITILGELIDPACKGAEATLLNFSAEDFDKDKESYLQEVSFADSIEIDNSIESAISGTWHNPRRALFTPIVNASNKESLLKEAYLVHGNPDDPIMADYKYPHHVIRNGKLVLHEDGVKAAFSRAAQQGIVSGDVKEHLLRHYRELKLDTENFAELIKESAGVKNMGDEKKILDVIEGFIEKIKDKIEVENEECEHDCEYFDKVFNKVCEACKKMAEDLEAVKADNEAYMAKVEAMADYEELKKFKEDTLEKEAKEKEMAQMQEVMADIEKRGVEMSDKDKEELIGKFATFSSIDAWTNFVKATMFDKVEKFDDVVRIADTSTHEGQKSSGSIWDKI